MPTCAAASTPRRGRRWSDRTDQAVEQTSAATARRPRLSARRIAAPGQSTLRRVSHEKSPLLRREDLTPSLLPPRLRMPARRLAVGRVRGLAIRRAAGRGRLAVRHGLFHAGVHIGPSAAVRSTPRTDPESEWRDSSPRVRDARSRSLESAMKVHAAMAGVGVSTTRGGSGRVRAERAFPVCGAGSRWAGVGARVGRPHRCRPAGNLTMPGPSGRRCRIRPSSPVEPRDGCLSA